MAGTVVLNHTNTDLLAANTRKKRQAQQTGIEYNNQGAYVLSLEDIKKKKQLAEIKRTIKRLND